MGRAVEPCDRPRGLGNRRPRRPGSTPLGRLTSALRAAVERAGKNERLVSAVVVWAVLGAVLAASGARPLAWGGYLALGVIGALLSLLAPARDRE